MERGRERLPFSVWREVLNGVQLQVGQLVDWTGMETTSTPNLTIFSQYELYLLCWLRGRASAEFPGVGSWQYKTLCLGMEKVVPVISLYSTDSIIHILGKPVTASWLRMLTFALIVSSLESLCWRVFCKSATRASLDCSCLCRSPISLLLDCSCTQWHSQYTNGQSQLLSHVRLSDEDYLLSQLS